MCRGSHGLHFVLWHQHIDVGRKIQLSNWYHSQIYYKKADLESATPLRKGSWSDTFPWHFTHWKRPDMTEQALWQNRERRKFSFLLVINYGKSCQTLWRGQQRPLPRLFLLSRAERQSSVSLNKAEQRECPRRNLDISEKTGVNTLYNWSNFSFSNTLGITYKTLMGW